MAHYKSYSFSQAKEGNESPSKVGKMLGATKLRANTLDSINIPFEEKQSISQSNSFNDNLNTYSNASPIDTEYVTRLSNIRNKISKKFERLIDILEERKLKLLGEIDDLISQHLENESNMEVERKKIESLIEQASSLGHSKELRDQITRSSQRSLCRHACSSSICRDAKLEMKDFCNELENLGRISVSDRPNYTMRNQCYSLPVRHGKGEKEIGLGAGVAVANQRVYVVDSENNRVQVFSLDGEHISLMKSLPKMSWPFGICVSGDVVYMTQQESHCVCMYATTSGELLSQAGGKGSGSDKLMKPSGLDVFESDVFVCDQENHRVQVFDAKKLSHRRKMTLSSMNHPTDCHVSGSGSGSGSQLLVLTMSDPCLHVFSLSGKHLRAFLSWGPGREVTTANFFTTDRHGNIILSEIGGNCLKVFSRDGCLLSKITCDGAIHQPNGIGLHSDGQIYIVHKGYKAQESKIMMC